MNIIKKLWLKIRVKMFDMNSIFDEMQYFCKELYEYNEDYYFTYDEVMSLMHEEYTIEQIKEFYKILEAE